MKRITFSRAAAPVAAVAFTAVAFTALSFGSRAQERQAALFPPTRFDGVYSVEVTPREGSCTPSHWTVSVRDGQITSISPNAADISALGLIETDGSVSLTFQSGAGQVAHVGGSVKGNVGTGFWSSPTLLCGGVWHAERER